MKSTVLFILLGVAIALSVYFTYQRSFEWKNFEIIYSEEEEAEVSADDEPPSESPDQAESIE